MSRRGQIIAVLGGIFTIVTPIGMGVLRSLSSSQAHLMRLAQNEEAAALYALQSTLYTLCSGVSIVCGVLIIGIGLTLRAMMILAAPDRTDPHDVAGSRGVQQT
jgi:hypothetical protein